MGKLTATHYFALLALLVVIGLIGWRWYDSSRPGEYDTFAQCLTDADATYYGAFWCGTCAEQNELFGNSKRLINYVECSLPSGQGQTEACAAAGITSYPTWEFADGERVVGLMSLDALAEKTGCELSE
jgi:hypothetical protein